MSAPLGHLLASCPGCARAWPTGSPRPTRPAARRCAPACASSSSSPAPRSPAATLTRPVARDVELYGPGDVVGIDPRAIVRTEPRNWITNFEPNYLAGDRVLRRGLPVALHARRAEHARPSRLRPWIALRRADRGRVRRRRPSPGRPLPSIAVDGPRRAARRPTSSGRGRTCTSTARSCPTATRRLRRHGRACCRSFAAALAENPDLAYSRLVCPRKLAENDRLPRVRRAGVRERPARRARARPGRRRRRHARRRGPTTPGREPRARTSPYYHRWFFRTGAVGDFEYLVRAAAPAAGRPAGRHARHRRARPRREPAADRRHRRSHGVLPLGGALRVPREALDAARPSRSASAARTGRARTRIRSSARSPRSSTWPTTTSQPRRATSNRRRRRGDPIR